jgi:hypothetical protein
MGSFLLHPVPPGIDAKRKQNGDDNHDPFDGKSMDSLTTFRNLWHEDSDWVAGLGAR